MADLFIRRLFLNEGERTAGLEPAFLHVRQRRDSLSPCRGLQLGHRDQLALEVVAEQPTISDERVGFALDRLELPVMVEHPDQHRVHDQQRRGPRDAADERIVIADDRVLHRVGQQQEHDEVERVELR